MTYLLTYLLVRSTIPNCLSLDTQYCPCQGTWGLGSLQNTENEANLLLPLGIRKLKGFQLLSPNQGLCRWTPLVALPPDPRYRLALRAHHVCLPHIF